MALDEVGVKFVVEGLSQFRGDMDKAAAAERDVGKAAEDASRDQKKAFGEMERDATDKSAKISKAIAGIGVALAGVAVAGGVAALKLATDLDSAYDSIQVKTGETGVKLDDLKTSFENVFQNVPSSAEDVATAIGTLNQKLDLTGGPLEAVATQVLNLSRITGTDLTANIDAVTGAFQRWQTPAEAMPGLLDELFRASQESGVPVADLATSLGDNKAIIDGLNLTMPEAIDLIAGMGKAGIDSDTAFGGLRVALTKMAKEGVEDPSAALDEYFQRIKDAPTDADAAAIAVEIFGRNSVGMASAIRDGTLDLDAFTASVDANGNTINGTATETDDWKEKLEILRNRIIVAISPALNEMFSGLTDLVDEIQPKLEEFSAWWTETAAPAIKQFWQDSQPLLQALWAAIQTGWTIVQPILQGTIDLIAGIAKALAEAVIVISSIIDGDWSKAWTHAQEIVTNAMTGIIGYIVGLATAFFTAGKLIFEKLSDGIMAVPILSDIVSLGVDIAGAVADWAVGMFDKGYAILKEVWDGAVGAWNDFIEWFTNLDLPSLPFDIPFGVDAPITVDPPLDFLNIQDGWLEKWWEEQLKKQEQADKRAELRRIWEEWWKQHPPDIGPIEIPVDLKFLPVRTEPIPEELLPDKNKQPGGPLIPGEQDELTPGHRKPGGPLIPGEDDSKPSLKDISDPASFLELVMRAIATIEALADADIAPVSKRKLLALAKGLRSIIVEFSTAMKGIAPETAEAAAMVATFLDPILKAIQSGADALAAIGGFNESNGIPGWPRIKAVIAGIHSATQVAIAELGALDTSKLEKTAATAELVANIMRDIAAAAGSIRGAQDDNLKPQPMDGTIGAQPGTGTNPVDRLAEILASFTSAIPRVGQSFEGMPGGTSFVVNAVYSNPQLPGSIALDLLEMSMRASAA